jgi:hypothetical protein
MVNIMKLTCVTLDCVGNIFVLIHPKCLLWSRTVCIAEIMSGLQLSRAILCRGFQAAYRTQVPVTDRILVEYRYSYLVTDTEQCCRSGMFLGLPDPDPLVRGPDPALDPSIIKQKQ